MILLGIKSLGVPEEKVLLALLLYRVAYYFFPFIIALGLSTFEFGSIAKNTSKKVNSIHQQLIQHHS